MFMSGKVVGKVIMQNVNTGYTQNEIMLGVIGFYYLY